MFDPFTAAPQRLQIDAEVETPLGHALAVRLEDPRPDRHLFIRERSYWIDLCLTPQRLQASGRYCDLWDPARRHGLGALIALPPRRRIEMETTGGRHASLICELSADAVERWLPEDFAWTDRRLSQSLDLRSSAIRALMLRLNRELREPGLAADTMCEALMTQLAIELARRFIQPGARPRAGVGQS